MLICCSFFCGFSYNTQKDFIKIDNVSTSASGAILMEAESRRILFAKNENAKMFPASCTKILTTITVIENADLDAVVEVDNRAQGVEGSSVYLRAGEHISVRELLYCLMLQSGNDSAVALACYVSGGTKEFAALMNKTAKKIGTKNSHFANPHGLHNDNHYTTAYDLGLISCYALNNEEFAKIVSTKVIKVSNEGYDYNRVIVNKNKLLTRYEFADGVKTGYTKKAGRCFVGSATQNGMRLVAVVLNCGPMFEDAQSMLSYGFNNYVLVNVIPKHKVYCMDFKGKTLLYRCDFRLNYPIKKDKSEDNLFKTQLSVLKNRKLDLKVTFANKLIFSQQIGII